MATPVCRLRRQKLLLLLLHASIICLSCLVANGNAKTTTTVSPRQKPCRNQGPFDYVFTRSFSIKSMQRYCEMLDSMSVTYKQTKSVWPSISNRANSCYDTSNWRFDPADFRFILKAVFRHHLDVNRDGFVSRTERQRFLEPSLRYHLLPGLLDTEYDHLVTNYFGDRDRLSESEFLDSALHMMGSEWRTLVRRLVPDLDGDNCVTRMEYARAVCRKEINDVDLYFRIADFDNNRAVTRPEFDEFKSMTPVEPGEEKGAGKFFDFFDKLFSMTSEYTEDYYQQTSFAHDDMLTFNEVNLYVCLKVI